MPGCSLLLRYSIGILFAITAPAVAAAQAASGTAISNTASAMYIDRVGHSFAVQSNTIVAVIANVAAVSITPNLGVAVATTDTVAAGPPVSRSFTLTNLGNVSDAYTVTALDTGSAKVTSIAFISAGVAQPVTLASTISPVVKPGGSISLSVTIATAAVPIGTALAIVPTVRSTNVGVANGLQSASGRQWIIVQSAPVLAGTGGPASRVGVQVNGVTSTAVGAGATVTYQVAFKNTGGSTAFNVVLTDTLPAGFTPDLASATINGHAAGAGAIMSAGVLTIGIGNLSAGTMVVVAVTVTLSSTLAPGTSHMNSAQIAADGVAAVTTLPASVFIGSSNILFDGDAGATASIASAIVTLLDPRTNVPLSVGAGTSARMHADANAQGPPSNAQTNPFTTGAGGYYSFTLTPDQLGRAGSPANYVLTISAATYLHRRIRLSFEPDATGLFYTVRMMAADAQPLAVAGGFTIVDAPVALANVSGLLGNVPLFKTAPLTLDMMVDRGVAAAGDRLVYTITLSEGAGDVRGPISISSALPPGIAYARGTARVDGARQEPLGNARTLQWSLGAAAIQHTIVFAAVLLPGIEDRSILTTGATADARAANGRQLSAAASAVTQTIGGTFSNRGIITGRVFADRAKSGHFEPPDVGVAGIRVFLESGESVSTDRFGRFSFPAVRPGQHVLRLDPTTLPSTLRASWQGRYDDPRSRLRFVHGLLDAGLIEDVNFALEAAP